MNYLLDLSYNGSNYHGWAKQHDVVTVQAVLEKVLSTVFDQKINCNCSGRTDAYVHAIHQIVNFHARKSLLPQKLKHSLNRLLPQDIYIHKIKIVSDQFHARFSAKSKTYLYKIYLGNADVVFVHNLALAYSQKLALNTLRQAAKLFVGQHDFRSFSISTLDNTVRTINSLRITHQRDWLLIRINANGFLRAMVRMIVGALLAINEHKYTKQTITDLLNKPHKGSAIHKAQACGLYLEKVYY